MQYLKKFYSWLFLRCLSWGVASLILSYGMKLLDREEKEEKNVIEGLVERPTVWTNMEIEHTSYM